MKNIVGAPTKRENFYKRDKIINRIYRRLDAGNHLLLAAPRRVGKTSIMLYLEEFPREGYECIYVYVESIHDPELFYATISKALLNSNALKKRSKASKHLGDLFEGVLKRISKVEILGTGVELNHEQEDGNVFLDLQKMMQELEKSEETVVIMLDEFPGLIENIKKKHGIEAATFFLQQNRALRQETSENVKFIYTGSVGLQTIVKQISSMSVINDINTLVIPPLTPAEGKELATLLLDYQKVPYQENAIDYLLERIRWLAPFYIQLLIQEVIDWYEDKEKEIDCSAIDAAFQKALNVRNTQYFSPMIERLKMRYPERDRQDFVLSILDQIADKDGLSLSAIQEIGEAKELEDWNAILDLLVFEGYINDDNQDKIYTFNSPLLLLWWRKNR
ncbi:MAG: ATP-binding protein [Bacteroidota bacterium]